MPEDELDLQELGEENQIAAFSEEEIKTANDLTELLEALDNTDCKEIQVTGEIKVTEKITVDRNVTISGAGEGKIIRDNLKDYLFYVNPIQNLTLKNR